MRLPSAQVIGTNIAHFRQQHRWSQRDLAKRIPVHQTMIARWEKGITTPRTESLQRLSEVLEVSFEELIATTPQSADSLQVTSDPEMNRLLGLIEGFEARDRDALKAFLEAIAMKNRVKAAVQGQQAV
ncbi:MAG: helix-turn-helix transcriptional regulator [Vulcanimicrobiota bacterium]